MIEQDEPLLIDEVKRRIRERRDARRDKAAERLGAALKEAYELNQENKEFTILELLAYLLEEERKKKIESGEIQPPYLKNFKPFK